MTHTDHLSIRFYAAPLYEPLFIPVASGTQKPNLVRLCIFGVGLRFPLDPQLLLSTCRNVLERDAEFQSVPMVRRVLFNGRMVCIAWWLAAVCVRVCVCM